MELQAFKKRLQGILTRTEAGAKLRSDEEHHTRLEKIRRDDMDWTRIQTLRDVLRWIDEPEEN